MSVSVIIPTFNRAGLLPRAVDSVLAQGWPEIEIVIVDDGSSDGTPQAIETLKARAPIHAIRQTNGGDAAARNAGLRAVRHDWIAFLDDDDTWRPAKLKVQMTVLEQTGAQACCGLVAMTTGTKPASAGRLLSGSCAGAFLRGEQSAAITSLLVRRLAVHKAGEFDTSLRVGSDMEWIARLAHEAEFCAVPDVVADYNNSPDALSRFEGIEQLIVRDRFDLMTVDRVLERCRGRSGFDHDAWAQFAARTVDRCAKHRMYAGDVAGAEELIARYGRLGAEPSILRRTGRKLFKAKLLKLVGGRIRHPKFRDPANIRG
jgi:glycosyltransferase involved in cell wall biosynthesis